MNDKHYNDLVFRFNVWLSDCSGVRLDPAVCTPIQEEPAPELPPHQKVALWDAACDLLLQNSSDSGRPECVELREDDAIPVEPEPFFTPTLTHLTNRTEISDNRAEIADNNHVRTDAREARRELEGNGSSC